MPIKPLPELGRCCLPRHPLLWDDSISQNEFLCRIWSTLNELIEAANATNTTKQEIANITNSIKNSKLYFCTSSEVNFNHVLGANVEFDVEEIEPAILDKYSEPDQFTMFCDRNGYLARFRTVVANGTYRAACLGKTLFDFSSGSSTGGVSQQYVDNKDSETLSAAKQYAHNEDLTYYNIAKNYADRKDVDNLTSAKNYTNYKVGQINLQGGYEDVTEQYLNQTDYTTPYEYIRSLPQGKYNININTANDPQPRGVYFFDVVCPDLETANEYFVYCKYYGYGDGVENFSHELHYVDDFTDSDSELFSISQLRDETTPTMFIGGKAVQVAP